MNHNTAAWLVLLVSLLFPFEVSRSVDRTSLTLGDPLLFKITARKKPDQKLIFPGPDASFGDFELKDLRSTEEKKNGETLETYAYTLTVFKLGDTKIPAMRVVNASDTADAKTTEPVEVIVKKIAMADTGDIVDIYGQESIGRGFWFYATIVLVVLTLFACVFFLERYFRKKVKAENAPVIVLSPEERFEKDMRALESARYLDKGEIKEFHLRMSEILRRYLGGRLGFEALESTTSELFDQLRNKKTERSALRLIEEFCDNNDPVKFAKWIPGLETSEKLVNISREVVKLLSPPKEPVPPAAQPAGGTTAKA